MMKVPHTKLTNLAAFVTLRRGSKPACGAVLGPRAAFGAASKLELETSERDPQPEEVARNLKRQNRNLKKRVETHNLKNRVETTIIL
jgi:hypothetical protein